MLIERLFWAVDAVQERPEDPAAYRRLVQALGVLVDHPPADSPRLRRALAAVGEVLARNAQTTRLFDPAWSDALARSNRALAAVAEARHPSFH